jgi:Rieske Fe-S protein
LVERLEKTANVRLFEGVSMLDVEGAGPLRLTTNEGVAVVAESAILATHAPFSKLTLQLKLAQYRSYVVAGRIASPTPGLFWDMADPYHYVRSASIEGQRYLVLGGEDHRTGEEPEGGPDAPYTALTTYASRFGVSPEIRWSAQVVESADGLPYIGRPDKARNLYVATGFGGNGMTFGTLAAMLIKDSIVGRDNSYAELYSASRIKPLASLGATVTENIDTAVHLIGDHVRPASDAPIADLPIGCGKIIKANGERLAVYRDHDGSVHALSSVCTHMGCQVAFNPMERSWDCPCHGSRFGIDGSVLDGPATKPLDKRVTPSG